MIDLNRPNVDYLIENGRFILKNSRYHQNLVEFDQERRFISTNF